MQTHDLIQGSAQWLEVRAKHFTASEAPAMLGLSKYTTRSELLRQKATGTTEDIDPAKQRLFDAGHEAEAKARPIAERLIGEDVFPVTGSREVDGLPLLASFDGLTMCEDVDWENKLWNEEFAQQVAEGIVPDTHWPQLEQQLLISGAAKALFTVSDGSEEKTVHTWYESRPERRAALIAGWKQFAADLAAYQHVEVIPAAVAAPIKELPTLFIQARGEVTNTNMPEFKAQITEFLGTINMKPATDQEFADGKEVAKKLRELAVKIKERKADMLAQTATIGEVAVEIDHLTEVINANALELEKAVKREEDARKLAIVSDGKTAFADHIAALNTRLGKPYMPTIPADFAEAIKGKRLVSAMKDAVDTLLANKKIEASAIADRIEMNLNYLRENAKNYAFLFADAAQIVLKASDDFQALAKLRIADHVEAKRKEEEATRERIAKEEREKADTEAAEQQRQKDAAEAKAKADATLMETGRVAGPAPLTTTSYGFDTLSATVTAPASAPDISLSVNFDTTTAEPAPSAAPTATGAASVSMLEQRKAIADSNDDGTKLTLGEVNAQLGFTVTAEFLASLGFAFLPAPKGNGKLYRNCDFLFICDAIAAHCLRVGGLTAARRAAA